MEEEEEAGGRECGDTSTPGGRGGQEIVLCDGRGGCKWRFGDDRKVGEQARRHGGMV